MPFVRQIEDLASGKLTIFLLVLALVSAGCALNQLPADSPQSSSCSGQQVILYEVMGSNPDASVALHAQAADEACRGQYDLALKDIDQAIVLNPDERNYGLRASIYQLQGKDDLAIKDLSRAIAINPDYTSAYLKLATIYSFEGNTNLASSSIAKALAADRHDSVVLNGAAWLMATSADPQVLNGDAAVKYAIEACDITSFSDASILDTLAASYARDGKYDEAVKWEKEALRIHGGLPSNSGYRRRLVLYEEGRPFTQTQLTISGS